MSKSGARGPIVYRGRRVNPKPPEPGVRGRILLQRLRREPRTAWPPAALFDAAGLAERSGWHALARLLELGLVERWLSDDAVVRVRLTPHGRRFRL